MQRTRPLRSTDPRQVAGYTLRGRLGEGGQGTVFLGATPDGREVAVKLLHADFGHDPEARRYLQRELVALQRVAPFCTARVLAADPDADPPYVVSEYVDGPSLQEAVRDRGVLSGTDLDRLAVAAATALGAIHAAGVVHRDFKPANVLLASDGPRVIDFGIARSFDATAASVSGVVGTPAYMAPEQLSGQPAGPALDMFAWGCTIAFAANGRPPFGHEPLPAVINRILNAEPDLGLLTGTLRGYVAACLAKDPARRPTAQQVLLGLMDRRRDMRPPPPPPVHRGPQTPWQASVPPATPPTTRPGRRRASIVVAGAVLAAALVATPIVIAALPPGLGGGQETPTPTGTQTTTGPTGTSPTASGHQIARTPRLGLEFWQDGSAAALSLADPDLDQPVTTVTMKPSPFELRLPTLPKDTAAQICAWTDDSVFSITGDGKTADHPCFRPGTGIADYEHGSATLYLNKEGHNYLAGTRVSRLSSVQDRVLFSTTFQDDAMTPIAGRREDLYLTVFIDHDGDGVFKLAGEGEYEYVVLDFPA
ncbi:serine/threonine-protein kinase [Nonomuraea sp. LPB2021202275-12-8]|uniref:serine/threonine-protein kinase n=1 Tax=Nonomuraea sp. LPB2021202275-12-8 TaxID=3120159 RepID=UPI00300CC37E